MQRQTKWQMEPSDAVSWHQDQALNATIFLLRETGPTSFLLKEDGEEKRVKVSLGDPHTCSCDVFKRERNPCKHVCWIILKRFKWPRNHEHQNEKGTLKQREITKVDVCPICQEELLTKHAPVTYCKFGCGNSIHIKCMKIWAEHQRHSTEDNDIKCPICRASFGSFFSLLEQLRNSSGDGDEGCRLDVHFSTSCSACNMCPIKGKCYKCTTCPSFFLCNTCFHGNKHRQHSFEFRIKRTHRWRPAKSRSQLDSSLGMTILNDLSTREITENDYDLLLQLDGNESETHPSSAVDLSGLPFHIINSLPLMKVRHGGKLVAPGKQCRLCLRSYEVGQYVRKLPECKHIFHRECIDNWLSEDHRRCPIDQQLVGMHRRKTPSISYRDPDPDEVQTSALGDASQLVVPGVGIAKLQHSTDQGVRHTPGVRYRLPNRLAPPQLQAQQHDQNGPTSITFNDMLSNITSVVPRGKAASTSFGNATTNRSRSGVERGLVSRKNPGPKRGDSAANLGNGLDLWLTGNSFVNDNASGS